MISRARRASTCVADCPPCSSRPESCGHCRLGETVGVLVRPDRPRVGNLGRIGIAESVGVVVDRSIAVAVAGIGADNVAALAVGKGSDLAQESGKANRSVAVAAAVVAEGMNAQTL